MSDHIEEQRNRYMIGVVKLGTVSSISENQLRILLNSRSLLLFFLIRASLIKTKFNLLEHLLYIMRNRKRVEKNTLN